MPESDWSKKMKDKDDRELREEFPLAATNIASALQELKDIQAKLGKDLQLVIVLRENMSGVDIFNLEKEKFESWVW